ncbi:UNVERIFIED_CONTAM: MOB kinase activator-like 1A [Sesamum indicum]
MTAKFLATAQELCKKFSCNSLLQDLANTCRKVYIATVGQKQASLKNFLRGYNRKESCKGSFKLQLPKLRSLLTTLHILTTDEADELMRPIQRREVYDALLSISDDKAPGPNGYSACSFKLPWSLISENVTDTLLDFFLTGKMLKQINATLLVLIPKSFCCSSFWLVHAYFLVLVQLRSQKTFRPKKGSPSGSKGVQLKKHIDATLGAGNLREAVKLPIGEDLNEWLAVNTVDFFNQVNILYATLTEFCTPSTCPTMTAGPKYEYRWADGVTIKKPLVVSAPQYVEYLMDWIEAQLENEAIFPQKFGVPFPPNFQDVVKTILKRLFRVYAHIYLSHFQKVVSLKEEAHLNTCFKHFVLFTKEFGLIEKVELAPLEEIIESILQR